MDPALPLSGLVAVEIGHSVAAPYGGQVLAGLGATLVKVENPGHGDDARLWGPPFWLGSSATFQSLNRDKLSVTVNLKDKAERDRLRRLIAEHADIVLQNMRPGLIEKFELGASLRRLNPRLIYCNLGAFGAAGPLRDRPGYDPLMQAFGGIMSITGEDGREPVRVGPSIIDIGAGMWSVIGILAALRRRELTGEGCEVDTSLYETALAWMTVPTALHLASGMVQGRTGSEAAMLVPYKAFQAADDWLVIAAGNDNLFRRLCAVLGRPEWAEDLRFRTNAERIPNRELLNGLIQEIVGGEPRAVWLERLERGGVPFAPLQTVDQVVAHEQTAALGIIQQSPDASFRLMGLPLSFDKKRPPFRSGPPALGEHNGQVFDELFATKPAAE